MLDSFVLEQKIVTNILKNSIVKGKYSHAYLIETNGYAKAMELALSFAKYLLCPYHYTENSKCGNCNQCKLIDQNIFSEVKIIQPDGLWIKKEQLDILQKEFMQTAIQSKFRIYIIKNAEKMNAMAANSILKFLEEPAPNIIAILLTDNMYQLLDTIVSRCQILSLKKNVENTNDMLDKIMYYINFVDIFEKSTIQEYIDVMMKFVQSYEIKGIHTLLFTQSLWHTFVNDRDKTLIAFEILILIYKDSLNVKLNRSIDLFDLYEKQIEEISRNNSIQQLTHKIKIINQLKQRIKLNVNQNLLIDELILEMEGVSNDRNSWCNN